MMTSSLCFFLICLQNLPKAICSIQTLQADSLSKVLQNMQFGSHVTTNDVIMISLPKTMENNGKMRIRKQIKYVYIYIYIYIYISLERF